MIFLSEGGGANDMRWWQKTSIFFSFYFIKKCRKSSFLWTKQTAGHSFSPGLIPNTPSRSEGLSFLNILLYMLVLTSECYLCVYFLHCFQLLLSLSHRYLLKYKLLFCTSIQISAKPAHQHSLDSLHMPCVLGGSSQYFSYIFQKST